MRAALLGLRVSDCGFRNFGVRCSDRAVVIIDAGSFGIDRNQQLSKGIINRMIMRKLWHLAKEKQAANPQLMEIWCKPQISVQAHLDYAAAFCEVVSRSRLSNKLRKVPANTSHKMTSQTMKSNEHALQLSIPAEFRIRKCTQIFWAVTLIYRLCYVTARICYAYYARVGRPMVLLGLQAWIFP